MIEPLHDDQGVWLSTACGLAAAVVIGYGATLAWDQHYDVAPDGSLHGPYSVWQVLLFILVLAVAAAWAGRRQRVLMSVVVLTAVTTLLWSVDAATDPPATNDGLWPVGAALVVAGTALGSVMVAAIAYWVARRRDSIWDG